MAAAAAARDFLSPESTVTSLLASSGHLRSSFLPPQLDTTIRFGDKDYESATEALEAYISDFDRSQHVGDTSTGRLILPSSPSTTPYRPRATLRNKDVLSERLSDRELDFLTLPVSSLRHRGNHDRLTMTTDELLAIPCDGSLPVTHTSALLSQSGVYPLEHSGLLSQSGAYPQGQTYLSHLLDQSTEPLSSSWPRYRPERLSYSHTPCPHHPAPPRTTRTPRPLRSRERAEEATLRHEPESYTTGPGATKQSNSKATERETGDETLGARPSPFHYPRWFTSQRSEMDFSGITSVPDLKYPAWVQDCDAASQELYKHRGMPLAPAPRPRAPSWLAELESSDDELQQEGERTNTHLEEGLGVLSAREQFDPQKSLRELRLQLAEKIALASPEGERSIDKLDSRFRDDKIESLIQKAERALSSSSLGLRGGGHREGGGGGGGEDCALMDPASPGCTVPCNEEPASPEPNNDPVQYAEESVTVSPVLNNDPIQYTKEAITASPGNTEELLDAERSWDNPPVTFKSPVPVGGVGDPEMFPETQTDGRHEARGFYPWGSGRRKHPGPVEALKQMLFTLQAMEVEVEEHPQQQPLIPAPTHTARRLVDTPLKQTAEAQPEVEDFESAPGGRSLQRALHHLERLKSLVEEPKDKESQRDQEKQTVLACTTTRLLPEVIELEVN